MFAVSEQIRDLDRHLIADMAIARLTIIRRALASGASTCFGRLLAALHDSRRRQAAVERARYRHLIHDPDTGACLGVNPTAQADEPRLALGAFITFFAFFKTGNFSPKETLCAHLKRSAGQTSGIHAGRRTGGHGRISSHDRHRPARGAWLHDDMGRLAGDVYG
jgi:hypothetical protein